MVVFTYVPTNVSPLIVTELVTKPAPDRLDVTFPRHDPVELGGVVPVVNIDFPAIVYVAAPVSFPVK